MPYSYAVYTGNGSTTQFNVSFPYIRREHVVVSIDYVSTLFTWVNNTTIQISPAPGNGTRVEVRRVTPVNVPLVDFADGSTLVAADLDTNALQQTYINQEQDDQFKDAVFINSQGLLDAGAKRLTNVGNPTSAQDAATKTYVDGLVASATLADANYGDITVASAGTAWTVNNGAITTAKVADSAVTEDKIAAGAVTSAKIGGAAVTGSKIASAAIGGSLIATGGVVNTHLQTNSVTTTKIANANVTEPKIADAAVTTAKIADANVTEPKIADAAVTTAKIVDANVTTAKIADDAVTPAKLAQPMTVETASGPHPLSPAVTEIDFTGIPSWVKRITVMFDGISTSTLADLIIQLGDSGGVETSNYSGRTSTLTSAGASTETLNQTGLVIAKYGTGDAVLNGKAEIVNLTGNTWVFSSMAARSDGIAVMHIGASSKTLSATLDRIRITTNAGTATFDGGTVNIMYEG